MTVLTGSNSHYTENNLKNAYSLLKYKYVSFKQDEIVQFRTRPVNYDPQRPQTYFFNV
jgi:hypothetical protein